MMTVAREHRDGSLLRLAALGLLGVAAVLGCGHAFLEIRRIVTVRPAVVVALRDLEKFLAWILGLVLRRRDHGAPVVVQLVASMLRDVQRAIGGVDRECHPIADAGGEPCFAREPLSGLVRAVGSCC